MHRDALWKHHGPFFDIENACNGALSGLRPCADLALTSLEGWGRVGVGVAAHRPPPTAHTANQRPPLTRRAPPPNAARAPRSAHHTPRLTPVT